MILNVILILTITSAIAGIVNLLYTNKRNKSDKVKNFSMEVELPGGLPIIALSNNGIVFNFLLDSGSNISHICSDYYKDLKARLLGVYEEGSVQGLGAENIGITMCEASLKDVLDNEYIVNLSISDHLNAVSESIEKSTGVRIHGLLGTDFLRKYNYVLDFNTLDVYVEK